jgi:hypothetical protein
MTALWAVGILVILAAIVAALTGLVVIAAIGVALAILNLVYLPRLATRLRISALWLALALIPVLLGAGLLAGGVSGAAWGAAIWLAAIGLPRAVGHDLGRRARRRFGSTRATYYDAEFRTPTTRHAGRPLPRADGPDRGGSGL